MVLVVKTPDMPGDHSRIQPNPNRPGNPGRIERLRIRLGFGEKVTRGKQAQRHDNDVLLADETVLRARRNECG
jgi:hypothetical protein